MAVGFTRTRFAEGVHGEDTFDGVMALHTYAAEQDGAELDVEKE